MSSNRTRPNDARPALPVGPLLPELIEALVSHRTVLLQAPPGAGKTTRVPPALLDARWLSQRRLMMLEPRRLAARAAARFMAAGFGQPVGETVGFRTRLETRVSERTRIEVVTEGILVRMLQRDPALDGYGAVVFDEFHERSLNADLGLALVREVQQALRDDLRVVVMSATLDTGPLAAMLGEVPVLRSRGRSHPVGIAYRPPRRGQRLADAVAAAVTGALGQESGSVLVFLPGAGEIRAVAERLDGSTPDDVDLRPLYGALPPEDQDAAIAPAPEGRRKVVLATSIAQTSLTIEGIRIVVDAGLERRSRFDPGAGMSRLITTRVSRAAAEQRAGRAGRVEPGLCWRLWSESEHKRLPAFSPPEILEADLAATVLELAGWGVRSPDALDWLDRPPEAHWNQAVELLGWLGALDPGGAITASGRAMLDVGLHPRPARMLVAGRNLGAPRRAARLAALVSERDPLGAEGGSDIETRLALLEAPDRDPGRTRRFRTIRKLADRLAGGHRDRADAPEPGALLALGWPDRVARRRPGGPARYLLANGRGAWLPDNDPLAGCDWLVAAELDGNAREARILTAARTDQAALEHVLDAHIVERVESGWDANRGTIVVHRRRRLGALVLDETELGPPGPEQQVAGLLEAVRSNGLGALNWTAQARQFCCRVECLRRFAPDDWPAFDRRTLAAETANWLGPFLAGLSRWKDVEKLDLLPALRHRLGAERAQRLDRLAPTRIEVPAGAAIRLDYCAESGPVLAVKLQAVFGWRESPRIAGGRIPVVLHLLDPAGRPLAVTSDLESFWHNAYPEVAGQMRGRYPKHPWPEDPLAATPTLATRRRT